ncbi:hypothetical protein BDW22DRAFT_1359289 [Trametopsis cervina]|nr:hypothetical protein BDW22DRAFT_1359289 [Trametopsis cervina]
MDASPALISAAHDVILTRYITISGLVVTLWDYTLILDREVRVMWKRPSFSLTMMVFCLSRYGLILGMLYVNTILVFLPSTSETALSNVVIYLVVHHLEAWEGRRIILRAIIAGLILTHIPALILSVIGMKDAVADSIYFSPLATCALAKKPMKLTAAWICVVVFDTFTVVLGVLNTFHRPRRRNADIPSYLSSDGALYFMLNEFWTAMFMLWPLTFVTLSRFILSSEASKKGQQVSTHSLSIRTDATVVELASWP